MNAMLLILKETFLILTPLLIIYVVPKTWWGLLLALVFLTVSIRQAIKATIGPKSSIYQGAGVGIIINAVLVAVLLGLWPPVWIRIPVWCLILWLYYNSYTILKRNEVPFFIWITTSSQGG